MAVAITSVQAHAGWYQTGAEKPGIRVLAYVSKTALKLKFSTTVTAATPVAGVIATVPVGTAPPTAAPPVVGAYQVSGRTSTTKWNVSADINKVDITDFVTEVSWTSSKEQNFIEASVKLDNRGQIFNWLPAGTLIVLQSRSPRWKNNGSYSTFLSVYMLETARENSGGSESITLSCYDRLKWLAESHPGNKTYKLDKRHKRGWTSRQIITDICKRVKIPVGKLGIANIYIKKLELTGDAMSQINAVITHVQQKTKEKNDLYRIHATDGKLNIVKTITKESQIKSAYLFNDQTGLEDANVSVAPKDGFATQLKIMPSTKWRTEQWKKSKHKGKVPKGYLNKPIIINPSDKNIQKVFGIITKENTDLGRKHNVSRAGLIKLGKAELDKQLAFVQTVSFGTRGQLGLWPESWVFLASGRVGVRGLFRVQDVSYTLSEGNLTMNLTVDVSAKAKLSRAGVATLLNQDPIRY